MERFLDSGFLELGDKLGPILWQFAPTTRFDPADFAAFLDLLPIERGGRALRHVVEVRHDSFHSPEFIGLLRERGVAVAWVDDEKYPAFEEPTADFVYLRLRRCTEASRPAIRLPRSTTGPRGCEAGRSEGATAFSILSTVRKSAPQSPPQALIERLSAGN